MKPEILLIGPGAIGSFYGGKLAQAGASVAALCHDDFNVIATSGITIKSILGDFHFAPTAIRRVEEYQGKADYVIVATKVLPEIDIPTLIRPAVKPWTSIVLLQNGIDIEKPVVAAYPENEIISGLAFICVSRVSPGHVHHQDYGKLTIGRYPSGGSEKVELLGKMFSEAGVPFVIDSCIVASRWKKLVWNAPFNPMSVLGGGVDTNMMVSNPASLPVVRAVMEEVALLAAADGHPLPTGFIEQNIRDTIKMTPYKTSMLLDYENRRPMEVEAILGNALRKGGTLGVKTPHMKTLYAILTLANEKNMEKHD